MRWSSLSRRSIIVGSANLLLLPGVRASAQPTRRRPKVAFLLPTAPDDVDTPADRVLVGLAELGYVDGQTASLVVRFAHHRLERLPALAAELVATQPDVIHTWTTPATRALAAATSTIPIVAAPIGEWGLAELVDDMVRPAGNITGLTLDRRDQQEKCLQILKEAAPHVTRVGVLRNPLNPAWRHYPEVLGDAARAQGLELVGADARGLEDIDPAFAAMAAAGVDSFFPLAEPTFFNRRPVVQRMVELAISHGWPSSSHDRGWAHGGGLVSLSSDHRAISRGAALYIHRILQGATPSELPVDAAFAQMSAEQVGAFLALVIPAYFIHRARLAELALRHRLPSVFGWREYPKGGGLMSYGPNLPDMFRRCAAYVDKILKGASPAELPVEQASRYEFVVNLNAARSLGLDISPTLLARATR